MAEYLGQIQWDFEKLYIQFKLRDKCFTLKGIPPKQLQVVESNPSCKMILSADLMCILQFAEVKNSEKVDLTCSDSEFIELQWLKAEYADVFEEPKDLPLLRGVFDHRIPLHNDATPVNIRPYRYPLKQRDIIEQLVQEMLDRGFITHSCSPFASPVVLVGKKDGTWRLCVDYRELNKKTVKDKFPIPIVEELIDELAGARVFSKLDLRAGYHQLRVHPNDVFKTAFKTHTGHFEFLVMPFGLTNAPSSFQKWMNQVFKALLRKCVLIFFDDILVFSKTLEDHWYHLSLVFELMREKKNVC